MLGETTNSYMQNNQMHDPSLEEVHSSLEMDLEDKAFNMTSI